MSPDFFDLTVFGWTGYFMLAAGAVLTLGIQLGIYLKLAFLKERKGISSERPVSILLTVRNEEQRIAGLLLQLLEQQYREFEIIVVDIFSEDNTLTIVGALAKNHSRLKFSALTQQMRNSEKMAVNLALKAASYDHVIFLSPEIASVPPNFLTKLNEGLTDNESLRLNYVNFLPREGFYNCWCRIERFYDFLTSAAYSLSGSTLFFQQANVFFPRTIYFKWDGFKGRMNDDFANMELLFNKEKQARVVVSYETDTMLGEDTVVTGHDFGELIKKRIRIIKELSWKKRIILTLEDFSVILLTTGLVWLLITEKDYWYYYLIPLVLVFSLHVFIVKSLQNRLNERKIFIPSLVYLLVRPLISCYYRVAIAIFMPRNKWI
ncbi:MAG: glycosyltransferase [Prolixibacteraceae bacterium]